MTEKSTDDLKERSESFIKEYGELVKKHQVDFASYPMFVPDGQGGFKISVQTTPIDLKNRPVKSDFVTTES